ncbi:hypothetical protein D9758_001780 [Tetrapyrgos nigripes]|uniref:Outer spore wall protein RRT8 n=1 Tax=Tetrapyrgos nigripes TaxID=182062 RepID=A0A8H5LXH9_9AGAR|nr:hypothetical protein D9758_001780 [Tetrapyrgos nigripes]
MDSLQSLVAEKLYFARDALFSGTWLYPFRGILYFVSSPNPSLYRAMKPIVLKCLGVSAGITIFMFTTLYLPHVAFCAIFGPFAFLAAATMVVGESYALVLLVTRMFFLENVQDKIFDAILVQHGHENLVASSRQLRKDNYSGFKTVGKSLKKPLNRFGRDGMIRYILSLPLNSLPVVGTVLFLFYNGVKNGPRYHLRYFQLKEMDKRARESFVAKRKAEYAAFGVSALVLELIPIVGFISLFTSIAGAALWASDLEAPATQKAQAQQSTPEVQIETETE